MQNVIKGTNLKLQIRLTNISSFYIDAANYNDEDSEKAIVIKNSNVTINGQQTIISPRRNGKILSTDIMLTAVFSVKPFSAFILRTFRENETEKKIFE